MCGDCQKVPGQQESELGQEDRLLGQELSDMCGQAWRLVDRGSFYPVGGPRAIHNAKWRRGIGVLKRGVFTSCHFSSDG